MSSNIHMQEFIEFRAHTYGEEGSNIRMQEVINSEHIR